MRSVAVILCVLGVGLLGQSVQGQHAGRSGGASAVERCIIVPQVGAWHRAGRVNVTAVNATVKIVDQAATTTLDVHLHNPGATALESELWIPVPDGAVVRGFSYDGAATTPTASILPRDAARRLYDSIVARAKDPALLEFASFRMIKSSLFPVEAGQAQRVQVTYEHLVPLSGNRLEYVLPRTESVAYHVPWKIDVSVESAHDLATVYSPSHPIRSTRTTPKKLAVTLAAGSTTDPGAFRLSCLHMDSAVSTSLVALPEEGTGGGYFLLLGGVPPSSEQRDEAPMARELTLVIDRSGSMNGEKIEQARQSALQVLESLRMGEAFRILSYSDQVSAFSDGPVIKTPETTAEARAYIRSIQSGGGTNLHGALVEALKSKPASNMLPVVLFLTDGLATVGETSESVILDAVRQSNAAKRRIFAFGVGYDVNSPLLDKMSSESRGKATFVLPEENIEVKVSQVFRRLQGPVLAAPRIEFVDANGDPDPKRVHDLLPHTIPDLFEDDQLVLSGRYYGTAPLYVRLSGEHKGGTRRFDYTFDLESASLDNAYVGRLWAAREIGGLVDEIRNGTRPAALANRAGDDPRTKELTEAIIALSMKFGILTEYTSFLALEGTDLNDSSQVWLTANGNLVDRAVGCRTGKGSVNQDMNGQLMRMQTCGNPRNVYWNADLEQVGIMTVQQISCGAFFRRSGVWIDSRVLAKPEAEQAPTVTVAYGSSGYARAFDSLNARGAIAALALGQNIVTIVDGVVTRITGPGWVAPQPEPTEAEAKAAEALKIDAALPGC